MLTVFGNRVLLFVMHDSVPIYEIGDIVVADFLSWYDNPQRTGVLLGRIVDRRSSIKQVEELGTHPWIFTLYKIHVLKSVSGSYKEGCEYCFGVMDLRKPLEDEIRDHFAYLV